MDPVTHSKIPFFNDFLRELFENELRDEKKYDPEVVAILKEHLGQENIQSRAGKSLGEALISLAKERSKGNSK